WRRLSLSSRRLVREERWGRQKKRQPGIKQNSTERTFLVGPLRGRLEGASNVPTQRAAAIPGKARPAPARAPGDPCRDPAGEPGQREEPLPGVLLDSDAPSLGDPGCRLRFLDRPIQRSDFINEPQVHRLAAGVDVPLRD